MFRNLSTGNPEQIVKCGMHPGEIAFADTQLDVKVVGPDDSVVVEETVTMVVQVNGKVRDRLEVPVGITEEEAVALALASDRVLAHTGGAEPRKVIARLPNVVSLVV